MSLVAYAIEAGWHRPCPNRHPHLRQFQRMLFHPSPAHDEMLVGIQETMNDYAKWHSPMSSHVPE